MNSSTSEAIALKPPSILPIILLSAAGFTVLTTEFIIVGLLPAMARDLHVTVSQAGLLVTLFAFTVAIVGPPLTAHLAQFPRKQLFVITLGLFMASNVLAAITPNIGLMAFARFVPALMLPVFWSLASETAVEIMGQERAGKAISMVSVGIVMAMIFGIPLGTLISGAFGWRMTFTVLAGLALLKAIMLFVFLPNTHVKKEHASIIRQLGILRNPHIFGHVLLSLLVFAGMFTTYTYLADFLERLAGFTSSQVGWILMGFGGVGMIGNWLGGKLVDRSPLGAAIILSSVIVLTMVALAPVATSWIALAVVLAVWGIAQSALFPASHVRVMGAANNARATPALGASLNISGANFGIALGAAIGGRVIDTAGLPNIGLAAAVVLGLAITVAVALMANRIPKVSREEECAECA